MVVKASKYDVLQLIECSVSMFKSKERHRTSLQFIVDKSKGVNKVAFTPSVF